MKKNWKIIKNIVSDISGSSAISGSPKVTVSPKSTVVKPGETTYWVQFYATIGPVNINKYMPKVVEKYNSSLNRQLQNQGTFSTFRQFQLQHKSNILSNEEAISKLNKIDNSITNAVRYAEKDAEN